MRRATLLIAACFALAGPAASTARAADITLFRFFGDCAGTYGNVTDLSKAVGECGTIQVLTNKFNTENTIGAKVITQTVDWNTYYDLLSATYATGNIPDVAVMHRSALPNFASRNLIEPIGDDLIHEGVDANDFVPVARSAVTIADKMYALPFDIHSILLHINMDLMQKAGLVTAAGDPVLPTSADELLQQGKKAHDATGKLYIAMESNSSAAMPTRVFDSALWQQGQDVVNADGTKAGLNTPAGAKAAALLQQIYAQNLTNKAFDYAGAQQTFLQGGAAIEINGTWVVDDYTAAAAAGTGGLHHYRVANLPNLFGTPAVWSDSHTWVIPTKANRTPEQRKAALAFLKFLNDNDLAWGRTGHLPVRQSVLASAAFKALPHRTEYAETAEIAHALPPVENQRAIQDTMISGLSAIWLTGEEPKPALAHMQSRVDQILRRAHH